MFFWVYFCTSYLESRFGKPGKDTVVLRDADSLQPLATITTPNPPLIRDAGYSDPLIEKDQYPWPGHRHTCTLEQLRNETEKVFENFCKIYKTLPQTRAYKHPAGVLQFYGNETWVDNAKRYKFRFIMATRRVRYHNTGVYAPPGEVISIDIPPSMIGQIQVKLNQHTNNVDRYNVRLGKLNCEFQLQYQHNEFAWPYGGLIDLIGPRGNFYGIEINITGGIRMPYFRYGVTTDEEWEEYRGLAAPLSFFDTGTFIAEVPSKFVRSATRLNDAMAFWQTVSWDTYDVNEVSNYGRSFIGYVTDPLHYNFDAYVPAGAAVAFVGANFIQAPPDWVWGLVSYDSVKWGSWGLLHEYHHHFQSDWHWRESGEVTNNVLNVINMAMLCEITSPRQLNFAGTYAGKAGGWNYMADPYTCFNGKGLLDFFALTTHWFGPKLQKEMLRNHIKELLYKRGEVGGYISAMLLTEAAVFKRDMRAYHYSFASYIINNMQETPDVSAYCNETLDALVANGTIKEFHPIALIYATGYLINGEETEHARPFRIPAGRPYYFVFDNITTRVRTNDHSFSFVKAELKSGDGTGKIEKVPGKENRIKFTPGDYHKLSKIYVTFKDNVNGDETIAIIVCKQIKLGPVSTFYRLNKNTRIDDAYNEFIANREADGHIMLHDYLGISIPQYSAHKQMTPWVCLSEGAFWPAKSGEYKFIFKHDEDMLFYISDTPLSGNITQDASHLIANLSSRESNFNTKQNTKKIKLEADKKYYWRFFLKNKDGDGYGEARFMIDDDPKVYEIDTSRVRHDTASSLEETGDPIPFIPPIRTQNQNRYEGDFESIMPEGWVTVVSHPELVDKTVNLTKILFDEDRSDGSGKTKIKPAKKHEYVLQFGKQISLKRVELYSNPEKPFVGNIDISYYTESPFNESELWGPSSLKMGHVNFSKSYGFSNDRTPLVKKIVIILEPDDETKFEGLTEVIVVLLASAKTSDDKITPITHSALANYNDKVNLTKYGLYFNGRGLRMQPGSRVDIILKLDLFSNIIAIIGDKSPYTAGKFDVYINDTLKATVNTQVLTYAENKALTGTKLYQRILTAIPNVIESRTTDTILVSLRGREGNPTVTGFVGPILEVRPIPDFDYSAHPIPGDPPLESTLVSIDELEPKFDVVDPDFIPVAPVNGNNTDNYFDNITDNSGEGNNTDKYFDNITDNSGERNNTEHTGDENIYHPTQTSIPNYQKIGNSSKTPAIVGGTVGTIAVVTGVAVAAVLILRAHKAAQVPMTEDGLVGGGGYDI